ncbi:MAG: ParB/RepB/Spo0J family partition protein [Acidobacteria bacterium]|nr:ParB/RepB/Spo0J family partition protein [Acidobacteriota bacterium]
MEQIGTLEVGVDDIDLTGWNVRKNKLGDEDDAIRELAGSIRDRGILQALLLRPHPEAPNRYQLVCGERRYRAAKINGMPKVPATVRNLTDEETREAMLEENIKREQLTPMEEAEAFNTYALKGMSSSEIAAKFVKDVKYVYGRLLLMKLPAKAKRMLAVGDLRIGGAMLIAQMKNDTLRERFVRELGEEQYTEENIDQRLERYRTDLSHARFDTYSESLVAEAGSCTNCPKQSGNEPSLFREWVKDTLCLDTVCFEKKTRASEELRMQEAKQQGMKVLSAGESKKEFPWGNHLRHNSEYVDLESICYDDPKKRTWGQIVKDKVQKTVTKDNDGRVRYLASKADVKKIAKEEAPKLVGAVSGRSQKSASQKEQEDKEKAKKEAVAQAIAKVSGELAKIMPELTPTQRKLMRQLFRFMVDRAGDDVWKKMIKTRVVEEKKLDGRAGYVSTSAKVMKWFDQATFFEQFEAAIEVAIQYTSYSLFSTYEYEGMKAKKEAAAELLGLFKIDVKALYNAAFKAIRDKRKERENASNVRAKKNVLKVKAKKQTLGSIVKVVNPAAEEWKKKSRGTKAKAKTAPTNHHKNRS